MQTAFWTETAGDLLDVLTMRANRLLQQNGDLEPPSKGAFSHRNRVAVGSYGVPYSVIGAHISINLRQHHNTKAEYHSEQYELLMWNNAELSQAFFNASNSSR